jgi:TP901 family phage tail tape measure protein
MGGVAGSGLSLGTLWIAISANVDQALKDFQKFGDDVGKMIDQQKSKWEGLATVGQNFSDVGKALSVGVTAPLVALGAVAATTAANFESSMNKVQAVSSATGAEMDAMRQQAIQLGADTKFSAQEAAEGMGALAAAGLTTSQTMAAMPGVLDLAAAGTLSVNRAAEITAETLGQFGLAADQAGKVADIFAQGAASSAVSVEDLAQSMKLVGPVANQVGMSLQDTTTALALLGNAGLKATEAGTGLRGVIASLEAPSKKAQQVLDELGVTVNDASGKMLPLDNIMKQLAESGATTGEMFKIFGRESAAAAAILKNDAGPAWDAMNQQMNASEGAAKRMADTLQKGLKGSLEQLKGSVETAMIQLGTGLNPILEALIKIGTNLVNNFLIPAVKWFSDLSTPVKTAVLVLASMAAAVGPLLLLLGQLAISISALAPAIGAMAGQVGVSSIAFAGIVGVVALVIAALAGLAVWANTNEKAIAALTDIQAKAIIAFATFKEAIAGILPSGSALQKMYADSAEQLRLQAAQLEIAAQKHRDAGAAAEERAKKDKEAAEKAAEAAKTLQVQITEQAAKVKELTKAHGSLATATGETGKKSEETADKIKGLSGKAEILAEMMRILQSEHQKAVHDIAAFRLAVDAGIDPTKELANMIDALAQSSKNADKNVATLADTLYKKMPPAMQAIMDAGSVAGGAEKAMRDLGITSEKAMEKIADGARDAYTSVHNNPLATEWEKQATEVKHLEAELNLLVIQGGAYSAQAIALRQRIEEIRTSMKNQADGVDELTASYHNLGMRAPEELDKLATKAKTSYETIAESAGANSTQAQAAWINSTEAAYRAMEARGVVLTETQKAELDRARTILDNHLGTIQSQWKIAYDAIHKTVMDTFEDLETKLITGKGSFAEILTNLWQDIAKAAMDYFFNPIKKAVADFIAKELADLLGGGGFGGLLDNLKQIGKTIGDVFSGASKVAGAAGGAASAAGGAASAGGSAAGTAGQVIGSSLTGVLTSVFSGISAVTDVLSLFGVGRSGEKDRLNIIANATTALAQMFGNPVNAILSVINTSNQLDNLNTAMAGWVHDAWVELLDNTRGSFDELRRIESVLIDTSYLLSNLIDVEMNSATQLNDSLNKLGMRLDQLLVSSQKQVNISLAGSDPALVGMQLATALRAQGALG